MVYLFKRSRARQRALSSLREWVKEGRVLPPALGTPEPVAYVSLPALDIPKLAQAYVASMESEESAKWCRCEWIIHPDDAEVAADRCRHCNNKKDHFQHSEEAKDHRYAGRRMRRGEQADDCPVHTREGFIIYFFEWVFTRGKN